MKKISTVISGSITSFPGDDVVDITSVIEHEMVFSGGLHRGVMNAQAHRVIGLQPRGD